MQMPVRLGVSNGPMDSQILLVNDEVDTEAIESPNEEGSVAHLPPFSPGTNVAGNCLPTVMSSTCQWHIRTRSCKFVTKHR